MNRLVEVFRVRNLGQLFDKFSAHQIQVGQYLCRAAKRNAGTDDLLWPKLAERLGRFAVYLLQPFTIPRLIFDGGVFYACEKASLKILQRTSLENDVPTVNEQHGGIFVSSFRQKRSRQEKAPQRDRQEIRDDCFNLFA